MTEAESRKLEEYLQGVATILFKNTPEEQLKDFGSIELAVRAHVLKEVAPKMGIFFKQQQQNRGGQSKRDSNLYG